MKLRLVHSRVPENPQTDTFRQWPNYVKEKLGENKKQKIAMFCTGGIRCEKHPPIFSKMDLKKFIISKEAFSITSQKSLQKKATGMENALFLITGYRLPMD